MTTHPDRAEPAPVRPWYAVRTSAAGRRAVLACGLAASLVAGALYVYRPALLDSLDLRVYDLLLQAGQPEATTGRVVIVDVDERSLTEIGRWPWRRRQIALLLDRLRALGASTIALDMMFPEPDPDPAGDAALVETLRAGRFVLGLEFTFGPGPGGGQECVQRSPLGVVVHETGGRAHPTAGPGRATGALCSLAALSGAVEMSGFLNAAPDTDGVLRRVPTLIQYRERLFPSLALATVAVDRGASQLVLETRGNAAQRLSLADRLVPVDAGGSLLLRFRGQAKTFPYVSAVDVLADRVPPGAMAGRIAVVGSAALGLRETVATPLDTIYPGVEVHATAIDNLLRGDVLGRPRAALVLELVAIPGVAMAAAVCLAWLPFGLASALLVAAGVGLWGAAEWGLQGAGAFVSPLFSSLALALCFSSSTLASFLVERRLAEHSARAVAVIQRLMLHSLTSLTETRDQETGGHLWRTQRYTRVLCRRLATRRKFKAILSVAMIELLADLAPLHDIGKVGVRDAVLKKPGELTDRERDEMRMHPTYGRDVIAKAEQHAGLDNDALMRLAKEIVYSHHEWWDGSGYPEGLRGEAIPLGGRVVALVDVYDALVSKRVYKEGRPHDEVVRFIVERRGTQFDPDVVDAFLEVEAEWRRIAAERGDLDGDVASPLLRSG